MTPSDPDAQAQMRIFDRVQKHLVPALKAHDLYQPVIHLQLLSMCLNALGVACTVKGVAYSLIAGEEQLDEVGQLFGAIEFADGRVINQDGLQGWEALNAQAQVSPPPANATPNLLGLLELRCGLVREMLDRKLQEVPSGTIENLVGSVLATLTAEQLEQATFQAPLEQGGIVSRI